MTDWKEVAGSQSERPKEIDISSSPSTVYQRKSIEKCVLDDETGETGWKYLEREMSRAEYESMLSPGIEALREENLITMQAQAEIYERLMAQEENQLTIMAAIADLYESTNNGGV